MKLKKFDEYLEKRLDPKEIAEIEKQAAAEYESLKALQEDVANIVSAYMEEKHLGFNGLVRKLDASPAHVSKIQKGEANLTLASLAHLAALMNKKPHITFKTID